MLRSILAFMTVLAACTAAAAQGLPASSTWKNERGSELTVTTVDATGKFSGTYVNRAAGFGCQDEPFDVSGHAWSRRVVFSVVWKNANQDCRSITTWAGFVRKAALSTTWQLARVDPKTGRIKVRWGRARFEPVK
ncbi:MAG TPA: avidin/streptavidin family protein [Xanthobacteraceae bacterium]|nr:avidin/streptavidin family protein [Xanthobacteraceae bacterium]